MIEVGDWVRTDLKVEGEVKEVRGKTATIATLNGFGGTVKVPVERLRIAARPQTGKGAR